MGVNFINRNQNLVISKSGKNNIKIVKLEVENWELKICVKILELFKIRPKWVDVGAGLRIAYSNHNIGCLKKQGTEWMSRWMDWWMDWWMLEPG